jgi:hypothetical protein
MRSEQCSIQLIIFRSFKFIFPLRIVIPFHLFTFGGVNRIAARKVLPESRGSSDLTLLGLLNWMCFYEYSMRLDAFISVYKYLKTFL